MLPAVSPLPLAGQLAPGKDFAELAAAWPSLSDPIKAAVMAPVHSAASSRPSANRAHPATEQPRQPQLAELPSPRAYPGPPNRQRGSWTLPGQTGGTPCRLTFLSPAGCEYRRRGAGAPIADGVEADVRRRLDVEADRHPVRETCVLRLVTTRTDQEARR